jgi:hypothetical protein
MNSNRIVSNAIRFNDSSSAIEYNELYSALYRKGLRLPMSATDLVITLLRSNGITNFDF